MDNRNKRNEHIKSRTGGKKKPVSSSQKEVKKVNEPSKSKAPQMFNVNSNKKLQSEIDAKRSASVSKNEAKVNSTKSSNPKSVNKKPNGKQVKTAKPAVTSAVNATNKNSDSAQKSTKKVRRRRRVSGIVKKNRNTVLVSQSATSSGVSVSDVAQEKNSRNKQKNASKSALWSGLSLWIIIPVIVLILFFIIYHLTNYMAVKPVQSFITSGTIEHTIGAKAMIVRNEKVIESTCKGDLVTKSTEGARVYASQQLAMVVPSDMKSVVDDLRNTQSQISDVQLSLIQQGMASGADKIYSDIDELMVPIIDSLRQDSMNSNLSNISSYHSSIGVLIEQREDLLLQVDFDDERLNDLRRDERNYENQLARSATMIYATNPGIVSFKVDGNEGTLTFDYMLNGDENEISKYINDAVGVIPTDTYIDIGDGVARIAKNEEQYIAVILSNNADNNKAFAVDTKHNINIPSEGVTIDNCKVVRETVVGDGLLVVFSTTKHVEDLIDLRSVDIEIVITEARGMKVSVNSLVNPDYDRGVATIYINKSGFVEAVDVLIVDSDREFAIIAPMGDSNVPNLNTVIISNPSSTSAGSKITS